MADYRLERAIDKVADLCRLPDRELVIACSVLFAVSMYRLVHELCELGVFLILRVMSEYAHGKTGMDIRRGKAGSPTGGGTGGPISNVPIMA